MTSRLAKEAIFQRRGLLANTSSHTHEDSNCDTVARLGQTKVIPSRHSERLTDRNCRRLAKETE
jgi:hypothetical protein